MRCLVLLSLFVCSYSTLALDEVLSIDSNSLKIRALTITDIEDPNEVGIKKTPSRLLFPELKVIRSPSLEGRLFYIDANLNTRCKGTNFVPQIWRQSGNKYEKIADFQLQQCDTVQPATVQPATVCCRRFNVSSDIKEGDVLGILHGNGTESSLSYKLNAGLRVLYEEEISNDSDVFFRSRRNDSRGTDYPLLAIETGVISNLLSCGTLKTLMITVMPDQKEHKIKFTCNATIESWSFVGTLQRGMNRSGLTLILQQRSCSGNHNCMMINKTEVDIDDFKDTIHPNVFKVSTVRWTVNAGDDITVSADNGVFALYSVARESRHLLHNVDLSSGPTGGPSPTDMPLLAIKTSPSNNCSWIMYDMETLANRALLVEEVIMTPIYIDGYLCIFPGISFTEEGSITKWTFAAKINSNYSGTQYPSLHLWRKSDDKYIHISGSNTNISEEPSIEFGALNVFSYKLNISYQQGDIIGVYQPPTNESALTLVCFNSSSFHTNITTTRLYNLPLADYTWNLSFIRPLMNLSVSSRKNGHLETENPSSEMSTSSEVSTTTSFFELNTGSVQQSGLNLIILLASSGVGGIVLILILVIIILIIIIHSRRKKESYNPSATQRDYHMMHQNGSKCVNVNTTLSQEVTASHVIKHSKVQRAKESKTVNESEEDPAICLSVNSTKQSLYCNTDKEVMDSKTEDTDQYYTSPSYTNSSNLPLYQNVEEAETEDIDQQCASPIYTEPGNLPLYQNVEEVETEDIDHQYASPSYTEPGHLPLYWSIDELTNSKDMIEEYHNRQTKSFPISEMCKNVAYSRNQITMSKNEAYMLPQMYSKNTEKNEDKIMANHSYYDEPHTSAS